MYKWQRRKCKMTQSKININFKWDILENNNKLLHTTIRFIEVIN